MPAILSLIETLKKYSDYLNSTAISMNELHHSNESARSPENNSTMYQVVACEYDQLKNECFMSILIFKIIFQVMLLTGTDL